MFERYTAAARRALFFARYAATRHRGTEIGTEHLLLGLLRKQHFDLDDIDLEQAAIAATILESAGVDRGTVEGKLTSMGAPVPTSVEMPFAAATKRVLLDAKREANQMAARSITTGHLLLGILQADGTAAFRVLYDAGVRLNDVRVRVEADVAAGVEGQSPE